MLCVVTEELWVRATSSGRGGWCAPAHHVRVYLYWRSALDSPLPSPTCPALPRTWRNVSAECPIVLVKPRALLDIWYRPPRAPPFPAAVLKEGLSLCGYLWTALSYPAPPSPRPLGEIIQAVSAMPGATASCTPSSSAATRASLRLHRHWQLSSRPPAASSVRASA